MIRWVWFEIETALAIHAEQLEEHGGGEGIRDRALLESALARPQQLAAYGEPDVYDLAAAYAFGVAKNHPFVDGNKRTAFVLAEAFLILHGARLDADDASCVIETLRLAAGEHDADSFAAWLRANGQPLA